MTLERNTSTTLDVTITPEEPLITSLIWESSDPTVATVDGSGNITALRPGTGSHHSYLPGGRFRIGFLHRDG